MFVAKSNPNLKERASDSQDVVANGLKSPSQGVVENSNL